MAGNLYSIGMPAADLLEWQVASMFSEVPIRVADWRDLRSKVTEGQEVLLVGGVPEDEWAVQAVAVVTEFDDEAQVVRVVV